MDSRLNVPHLPILNPPLWELGHIAWFHEHWCVRDGDLTKPSIHPGADDLYNSTDVIHRKRWSLPLLSMNLTREYAASVFELASERLARCDGSDQAMYFHRLHHFHEAMHLDAFLYTWQTVAYPRPSMLALMPTLASDPIDLSIDAASVQIGSQPEDGFCFDNEKWAQHVDVDGFSISAEPISNGQFAQFVLDGGYQRANLWDDAYFAHLSKEQRSMPIYWSQQDGTLLRRNFDIVAPLQENEPMLNLSAFEAEAYCRWAKRRLPSEAEWVAATSNPQMRWASIAWEWTSSRFEPLPGFSADPYKEYSEPWFYTHRVVRGGSFATHPTLVQNNFRNFYLPERADPYFGFRTCAL